MLYFCPVVFNALLFSDFECDFDIDLECDFDTNFDAYFECDSA